jgi:hypothetical protein
MSRLEKHLEKETKKRMIFLVLFFLVAIYLSFTFGLPLIINTSVFISQLNQKPTSVLSKNQNNNYALLTINEIPMATNSSKIDISGSTFNLDKVTIYLNSKKIKEKNVYGNLDFTEEITNLNPGNNEIYFLGFNKKGEMIKKTKPFVILYKDSKPKLEITSPKDNTTVDDQSLTIKGTTDKETVVKINEAPVVVDALGNFEADVGLIEGENKIKITASDIAGNQEEKTLTVTYQKEN